MRYIKSTRSTNCNSKMAVYLMECEICGDQYTAVQKQNLDLGQVTLRVRIGKL